jgi:hypothetical protein
MGVNSFTEEQLNQWLEKSCTEQGVGISIDDPETLSRIFTLLKPQSPSD